MRIQHNIMAMNAYRNYNANTSALSRNLEKLSSGYKINRAGDDAAGLAISEKMRAQITGLNAAQKNVKDGISLVKTAEGAMQEIQDMLNRMDYLATQSANGTYDNDVDRKNLQKEVEALKTEINRIADSANFNGIKLLDGSLDTASIRQESVTTGGMTGQIKLPGAGELLGVDTVLHKGNVESAGTEFSVNLGNHTFSNREGDVFTMTIGDGEDAPALTLDGVAGGEQMDSKAIASALAEKYKDDGIMLKDADGNEQKFTVGVGKTGYDLVFKQEKAPLSEGEVVQAPNSVKLEGTDGPVKPEPAPDDPGTPGVYTYTIGNAFVAGDKLTIAGKEITFDLASTGENSISATDNLTAGQQATAIANLFKDSADWKVEADAANGKLTFTQKVASEAGALKEPTISSSINGTGKLSTFTEKDAFTPASYEFDFTTNAPANGEQLNLGKIAVKFVSGTPAADNEIKLSGNTATDLNAIAAYINKNSELAGFTAKADGTKLTLTANEGTTEVLAGTNVTKKPASANPAVQANDDGTWTISFEPNGTNSKFAATDKLNIMGVAITFDATAADTDTKKLKAGDTLANTATGLATIMNNAAKAADSGTDLCNLEFKANADGTVTVSKKVPSDLGKIAQSDVTMAGDTSAAAPTVTPTTAGAASWTVGVDTLFANGDKLILEDAAGNKTTISFDTAGSGGAIDVTTEDTAIKQATAIQGKANTFGKFTVADNGDGTLTFTQTNAGDGDIADLKISVEKATTGTGTFATTTAAKNPEAGDPADDVEPGKPLPGAKDYLVDVSTIKQGVAASATRLASTIFTLNDDIIKDGNILKIGDQSFTIKRGADSTTEAAEGTTLLDLSKFDDADVLHEAAIMLSNATVGNGVFESSGYDGNSVSFLEKQGTSEDLTTFENIEKQFAYGTLEETTAATMGNPLTLQIGDTSDKFNQLELKVGDMHTKAMGSGKGTDKDGNEIDIEDTIASISVAKQEDAQKAIQVIKNAINYVSGVRGDLGATQNRLEHTANNLSVMAENIQDAESTIRDTDIAEEMMAYTKNNILVQSAQAMLAQANAVPQGVLQLLG